MVFCRRGCSVILSSLVFYWSSCIHRTAGFGVGNTIGAGKNLRNWDYLESSNKLFRLLFFSFSDADSARYYLGIRRVNSSGFLNIEWQTELGNVVWVANGNNPLPDTSGSLSISQDGNLVITGSNWTNFTINAQQPALIKNSTTATLLDTGNLVLRVGEEVAWQSFDYPTHVWLPGMKLGLVNITSWAGPEFPSRGDFTLGVDPNSTKQLVIWRKGHVYWSSNVSYFPDLFGHEHGSLIKFSYSSNKRDSYFTFTGVEGNFLPWINIGPRGDVVTRYINGSELADVELLNLCSSDGEEPGCIRGNISNCYDDIFIEYSGSMGTYQWIDLKNKGLTIGDCENICRRNCSCTAYASPDGSGCKLSYWDRNFYQMETFTFWGRDSSASVPSPAPSIALGPIWDPPLANPYFGTVADQPLPGYDQINDDHQNKLRNKQLWLAIGRAIGFLAILTLLSLLWYLSRRCHLSKENKRRSKEGMDNLNKEIAVVDTTSQKQSQITFYSLFAIQMATDHFSEVNKLGQGGFGPVYKGKLAHGQEIAVKRLNKNSGQGLQEFKNEVMLISKLQHRNLIRLLGCCIEANERILIYEYMHNKSLDSFLFDEERRALLDWNMRVGIIEGIAHGLLYLHEHSRLRIIHRDLKTSNILLDCDMNPRISDFGTARVFGDNESRANTERIAGTYGYMSPEYAMNGLFSVKSDIFSFGVMILEIISGKKNTGFYHPDRALNLLGYAWDLWKEGRGLEILDQALVGTSSTSEVLEYIQVGFLCVQESATDRPTISEIVKMLNNETIHNHTPKQPAFSAFMGVITVDNEKSPKSCTMNDVTITKLEGR